MLVIWKQTLTPKSILSNFMSTLKLEIITEIILLIGSQSCKNSCKKKFNYAEISLAKNLMLDCYDLHWGHASIGKFSNFFRLNFMFGS